MERARAVVEYFTCPFEVEHSDAVTGAGKPNILTQQAMIKYKAGVFVWLSLLSSIVWSFNFCNIRAISKRPTSSDDLLWFVIFEFTFLACPFLLRATKHLALCVSVWAVAILGTGEVFNQLSDVPELELNPCLFMMAIPLFVCFVDASYLFPISLLVCYLQRRWIYNSTSLRLAREMQLPAIVLSLETLAFFFNVMTFGLALFGWYNARLQSNSVSHMHSIWQETEQSKEMFVSCISHELRNPLQTIIGCVQLLNKEPGLSQNPTVVTMSSCCQLLHAIINDVLDLTKLHAARLTLENISFDPDQLLQDCLSMTRVQARPDVAIEFEEHALPPVLMGDKARIAQVCVNLLSNAFKFTDKGSVTLRASFKAFEAAKSRSNRDASFFPDGLLEISVKDTGIGIPESALTRIFQPFTQSDSSITRRFGGTGLGLYLSQRLATLMNGSLKCISACEKGSTFTFTVPCRISAAQEKDSESPTSSSRQLPVCSDTQWQKRKERCRVLIVDDMEYSRFVLDQMLKKLLGFQHITTCSNGQEALDLLTASANSFDIVISDVQMPLMDGLTAVSKFRQHERAHGLARTPVVMLTGNSTKADEARSQMQIADSYLLKPVRSADLETTLRLLLCSKKLQ